MSPADLIPTLVGDGIEALGVARPDGVIHLWWGARGPSGIVLAAWERAGTVVANSVAATNLTADKFLASGALAKAGFAQLPQAVTTDAAADERAAAALGYPLVMKPVSGSSGRNTHLIRDIDGLRAAGAQSRAYDGVPMLLQPFVAEADATDRRLFILGGLVLAAIERTAQPGDFRSNVAQGGSAVTVSPTPEEAELAITATSVLGLDYAGVDLIQWAGRPTVLEVNAAAQFEALERVTGANVAGAIAGWLAGRLG